MKLNLVRSIHRTMSVFAYLFAVTFIVASVGTTLTGRPLLFEVERSNSMVPVLQRGDVVLIFPTESSRLHIGDIVMFKAPTGRYAPEGWIVHRIVGGDTTNGFLTKGDANDYADQALGGVNAIQPNWIANQIPTIHGMPIKIPYLGYLSLWFLQLQDKLYMLPAVAIVIALLLARFDATGIRKRAASFTRSRSRWGKRRLRQTRRSKRRLEQVQPFWWYMAASLVVFGTVGALILHSSSRFVLQYGVAQSQSMLSGSSIGVISLGQTVTQPIATLSKQGPLPTVAVVTSSDPQLTFQPAQTLLATKNKLQALAEVHGQREGNAKSVIWVGMFPPLLPPTFIYWLAHVNFWYALCIVSSLPALPIFLYPWLNTNIRRATLRELRKTMRNLPTRL